MPNPTTFTFVRDLDTDRSISTQKLWRLDHPIPFRTPLREPETNSIFKGDRLYGFKEGLTLYVVSSFAHSATLLSIQGQPELYLFPASEDGKVIDWSELPGSQKGSPTHEEVLTDFIASFTE